MNKLATAIIASAVYITTAITPLYPEAPRNYQRPIPPVEHKAGYTINRPEVAELIRDAYKQARAKSMPPAEPTTTTTDEQKLEQARAFTKGLLLIFGPMIKDAEPDSKPVSKQK